MPRLTATGRGWNTVKTSPDRMRDRTPDPTGNYETALAAAEKGYSCIPCIPGTKVPAVRWGRYSDSAPT